MKYLPLYLDLRNRRVVVIGNGPETWWKTEQLVESGAQVFVVGPEALQGIKTLEAEGKIAFREGYFQESDLDSAWLVVGTAEDETLNRAIVRAAEHRRIFYNIVDVTRQCAFIYPAIVARDDLQIAISTSGNSPALAQRLKREISDLVGPEYGVLNDLLGKVRSKVLRMIPDRGRRAALFHKLVDSRYLHLLKGGERTEVEAELEKLVDEAGASDATCD